MSIEQRVQNIKEDLDFFDDELAKYEYIIDLGKKLEEFKEKDKIPANIVHGCTSQVWLTKEIKDGKLLFKGTSDAIFSNSTIEELKEVDMDIIHELKLSEVITPNRQSGVIGMIKKIKEYAQNA